MVQYKKRYMTKAVYNCKRYILYIPVSVGDRLDLSVDYDVQFQDPVIIFVPKKHVTIKEKFSKGEEPDLG